MERNGKIDESIDTNNILFAFKLIESKFENTFNHLYFNEIKTFINKGKYGRFDLYEGIIARVKITNYYMHNEILKRFEDVIFKKDPMDEKYYLYWRTKILNAQIYCFYLALIDDFTIEDDHKSIVYTSKPCYKLFSDFKDDKGYILIPFVDLFEFIKAISEKIGPSNVIVRQIVYYHFDENGEWYCKESDNNNYSEAFYKLEKYQYQREMRILSKKHINNNYIICPFIENKIYLDKSIGQIHIKKPLK